MTVVKLKVPLLAQEKSMCCWHTSAMMIWLYWQGQSGRQGPMNTLTPVYTANTGLYPQSFITLAQTVGLRQLAASNNWSNADLFRALRDSGPIWCAGHWYGVGHVIVLTGVDGGTVYLNDPDGAHQKTGTLAWFNEKLASNLAGCMQVKNPKAY
jgi:ABC-type bacteriocin/lantibiotic exporter with double-glycine peptidase domain